VPAVEAAKKRWPRAWRAGALVRAVLLIVLGDKERSSALGIVTPYSRNVVNPLISASQPGRKLRSRVEQLRATEPRYGCNLAPLLPARHQDI
jgi:hypothetical protein